MAAPVTYSTTAAIRTDCGFDGNPNVTDPAIDALRVRAKSLIDSAVGTRYAVPAVPFVSPFLASPAAAYLETLEVMLAGALLLIREYGPEGRDTDKDGYRRKADADAMLKDVVSGAVSLFGSDGALIPSVTAVNAATIRGNKPDPADRKFSVDMVF